MVTDGRDQMQAEATAQANEFFAKSANKSGGEHYAGNASCSDHSPDAGNMVSAAVPREEDVARAIFDAFPAHTASTGRLVDWSELLTMRATYYVELLDQCRVQARAVLALFAPILAEKERLEAWSMTVVDYAEKGDEAYDGLVEKWQAAEARALAAEAALAEKERHERTIAARDRRIARLVWAMDYARLQGVVFPADAEPKVVLSAAAIRSQGQP